jgi:radical SAM protein with 4Fe4S-binding SPASM domain
MFLKFINIQFVSKLFRYLSLKKTGNLFVLLFSYIILFFKKEKVLKSLPIFISVESANYCNLHCPECPVGKNEVPVDRRRKIEAALYKKLIDQLKSSISHVILYFQGEPFLNKELDELIRYAHDLNIYTSTSTNGQFLTKKNAQNIVSSGLDKIIVSMDGSTQEVYEKYRVGGSLNKVVDGIKNLVAAKSELRSATPLIELQFLVLKINEHQLVDMKRLAQSLGVDKLTFKTAQLYDFENGNDLMPSINKYSRYKKLKDGKFHIKSRQPNRCWRMWSGAVVNANGDVLPCCFDKNSEHSFGNIHEMTFEECWNSEKASDFRRKLHLGRNQIEMCRNCTS